MILLVIRGPYAFRLESQNSRARTEGLHSKKLLLMVFKREAAPPAQMDKV
jgi:hypothetical protein